MLLLAIDVSFKGFYSDKFHDIQKYYLVDVLGFYGLYDVIKRHKKDEFYDIISKYGLNSDIVCTNGKLKTNLRLDEIGKLLELDLNLPGDTYEIIEELDIVETDVMDYHKSTNDVCVRTKTLALTFKNKMRYSKVHIEQKQQDGLALFLSFMKERKSNVCM